MLGIWPGKLLLLADALDLPLATLAVPPPPPLVVADAPVDGITAAEAEVAGTADAVDAVVVVGAVWAPFAFPTFVDVEEVDDDEDVEEEEEEDEAAAGTDDDIFVSLSSLLFLYCTFLFHHHSDAVCCPCLRRSACTASQSVSEVSLSIC